MVQGAARSVYLFAYNASLSVGWWASLLFLHADVSCQFTCLVVLWHQVVVCQVLKSKSPASFACCRLPMAISMETAHACSMKHAISMLSSLENVWSWLWQGFLSMYYRAILKYYLGKSVSDLVCALDTQRLALQGLHSFSIGARCQGSQDKARDLSGKILDPLSSGEGFSRLCQFTGTSHISITRKDDCHVVRPDFIVISWGSLQIISKSHNHWAMSILRSKSVSQMLIALGWTPRCMQR